MPQSSASNTYLLSIMLFCLHQAHLTTSKGLAYLTQRPLPDPSLIPRLCTVLRRRAMRCPWAAAGYHLVVLLRHRRAHDMPSSGAPSVEASPSADSATRGNVGLAAVAFTKNENVFSLIDIGSATQGSVQPHNLRIFRPVLCTQGWSSAPIQRCSAMPFRRRHARCARTPPPSCACHTWLCSDIAAPFCPAFAVGAAPSSWHAASGIRGTRMG